MATNPIQPAFFWYPEGRTYGELIIFPEQMSSVHAWVETAATDAESFTGRDHRVSTYSRYRVRIEMERMPGTAAGVQSFVRALRPMIAHLQRGGMVGFCVSMADAYLYFSTITPAAGATKIKVGVVSSPTRFWYESVPTTPIVAASDEVWLQSAPPESLYEMTTISALTSLSQLTLGDGIIQKYGGQVAVRNRDFWPVLRMPVDAVRSPVLTHTGRLGYTLDMTLVEDAATMFSWAGQTLVGTTAHVGRLTVDEVAARSVSPVSVTPRGPRSGTTKR